MRLFLRFLHTLNFIELQSAILLYHTIQSTCYDTTDSVCGIALKKLYVPGFVVNFEKIHLILLHIATVIWRKYCKYGVRNYSINQPINQSINQSKYLVSFYGIYFDISRIGSIENCQSRTISLF